MTNKVVWCVDDDNAIRDIEVYALESTGFKAKGFSDGRSMSFALQNERPSLIILDVMLPEEDGMAILKKLRADSKFKNIPVIMATARGTEMDKIQGLDTGADDYLVKPFGMMEMVARVKAVLRRCDNLLDSDVWTVGNVTLSDKEHVVTVDNQKVTLTLKEYDILRLFLQNPGIVFSRDRLLSVIWGVDYLGESRTVDMHIKTLRQKLGESGKLIKTVIGVGYQLEASK